MNDRLGGRDYHSRYTGLRYACLLLVAAVGLYAAYAGIFEARRFQSTPHWMIEWAAGYGCFVAAFLFASRPGLTTGRRTPIGLVAVQSAAALFLVWLYPSFIVTCLLVVVAWQVAWSVSLRIAMVTALLQAVVLAAIKCVGETESFSVLILITTWGFQAFAISAAHLAQSEMWARNELERANAELRATQVLMTESARMTERLRISRDLHDVLGHNLTSLAIQLDVAARLVSGLAAAEHVRCARDIAGSLLAEVRTVVSHMRVEPVDLRAALRALTENVVDLQVELMLPEELVAVDAARADTLIRCVQEVITNTLRHARAKSLTIELQQSLDGSITFSARNDGRGGPYVEGRGLAGMRERFEMLGGHLSIASQVGEGFSIRGAIPGAGALS